MDKHGVGMKKTSSLLLFYFFACVVAPVKASSSSIICAHGKIMAIEIANGSDSILRVRTSFMPLSPEYYSSGKMVEIRGGYQDWGYKLSQLSLAFSQVSEVAITTEKKSCQLKDSDFLVTRCPLSGVVDSDCGIWRYM